MQTILTEELLMINGGQTVTRGGVKYEVTISDENKKLHKELVQQLVATAVGGAMISATGPIIGGAGAVIAEYVAIIF